MASRTNSASPQIPQTPLRRAPTQEITLDPRSVSRARTEQGQQPSLNSGIRTPPPPPLLTVPHRTQNRAPNYITLGMFRIDPTNARISLLLSVIKKLSILTSTFFWIVFANCFTTLLFWGVPWRVLYELITGCFSGTLTTTTIWRCLFPGTDNTNSHHLRLAIHTSSYTHSPVVYSTSIPLNLGSTMTWFSLMTFLFISNHLLCFFHDCLTQPTQP
jgi:hypothetical protein